MSRARDYQRYFEAAIEGARYFNGAMAEAASTSGVFDALAEFSTAEEACVRMGFHASRVDVVQALLRVLTDGGLLETKIHGGHNVYRSRGALIRQRKRLDGGLGRYQTRLDVIAPWQTEHHVDTVHDYMLDMVGNGLDFMRQGGHIQFNAAHLDIWRWNLQNPMYDWARVKVVQQLVTYGHRFLDLACGPGFGTQRIVQLCPRKCEVVGVDRSMDFLRIARQTVYPDATVEFVYRDLNDGLPSLRRGYFDGILFNGAFHFIEDKPARLREMRRALRPGGLLVLGHCFSRSGFEDESMHDLYFALIDNTCFAEPWDTIRRYVSQAGFEEVEQFHRGSHSYLLVRRDANPADMPDARATGGPTLVFGPSGGDGSAGR